MSAPDTFPTAEAAKAYAADLAHVLNLRPPFSTRPLELANLVERIRRETLAKHAPPAESKRLRGPRQELDDWARTAAIPYLEALPDARTSAPLQALILWGRAALEALEQGGAP